jgi:hypothetical protein
LLGLASFYSSLARRHEIFQLNAQGVRESVDVIEVADDVDQLQDSRISKTVLPEGFQVIPGIGGRLSCHFDGKVCESSLPWCELRSSVVPFDLSSQFGIAGRFTEILPVRLRSVMTIVRPRYDGGDHLSLAAGQFGGAVHELQVELQEGPHHIRSQAVDGHDFRNSSRPFDGGVILPFDISLSFILGNRANPSHWITPFLAFLFFSNTIGRETLMGQGDVRKKLLPGWRFSGCFYATKTREAGKKRLSQTASPVLGPVLGAVNERKRKWLSDADRRAA